MTVHFRRGREEDLNLYEEAERRLYHTGRGREEDRILHEEEEEGKSQKL